MSERSSLAPPDPQPQEDGSSYDARFPISESLSEYDSDSDTQSCISTDHLFERHRFYGEEGSSLGLSLEPVNDFDLNQEYLLDFMVDLRSEFGIESGTDLVPRADGLVARIDRYDPYITIDELTGGIVPLNDPMEIANPSEEIVGFDSMSEFSRSLLARSDPQNQNDARFPIAERILDSDSSSCITNEIDLIIDDSEILSSFVDLGAEVGVESGRNEARLGDGSGTMVAGFDDQTLGLDDYGIVGVPRNWGNPLGDHAEPLNTTEDEEFEWVEPYYLINEENQNFNMIIDGLPDYLVTGFGLEILSAAEEVIMDAIMLDAESEALFQQFVDNDLMISLPAANRVVENLPLVELGKDDLSGGAGVVCAICRDEVREGEMVNRLPCLHYYHGECIRPWLRIKNTCPVCRYQLPVDGE